MIDLSALLLMPETELLTAAASKELPAVCSAFSCCLHPADSLKLENMISGFSVIDFSICLLLSHVILLLTSATAEELPAAYFP